MKESNRKPNEASEPSRVNGAARDGSTSRAIYDDDGRIRFATIQDLYDAPDEEHNAFFMQVIDAAIAEQRALLAEAERIIRERELGQSPAAG